ncbi:MAG: YihA family ribosome biogenesis GTP-binding protein [Alphaproteobacteria bacterium]|jgi:GTP-binding protein|nr:YihA family ribosome biogenesis GTP-binding protein [Alphaproteobacteria bacterium]QQS57735.1 MAG: YihA family ribosome biogenesis GTP-binding protein [Alphaproteobacteria bacterium]
MQQPFTDQQIEAARILFSGPCDFMLGVAGLEQLPETDRPEVAFAGRSNVGKSSLVNALTGRKTLARTSNTPGRTQQLNFFNLGDALNLVDMPGYGYAKVSKTQIADWTKLIFKYLRGRANLRCVFVLVDARHGLKDSDGELMDMLDEAAVSYRVVLTKIDKIKDQERETTAQETLAALSKRAAAFPGISLTSAEKGTGIPDLRAVIAGYAG